jgi:hypothetical protein
MSANTTDRIRMLNDELRQHLSSGGSAVMTPGVAALGSEAVQRLVQTITIFDDFCTANDPHGEHDFGAFEFEGAPIGGVRDAVGIRFCAFSGNMKVSFQATRSIG